MKYACMNGDRLQASEKTVGGPFMVHKVYEGVGGVWTAWIY